MKKTITVLFLVSIVFGAFAQNSPAIDKIFNSNTKYFKLDRDAIHLHLNKTTFVAGDEVWFKAYFQNRTTQKLTQDVTNLYVALYDTQGKQIFKQLFFVENSVSSGSILIDDTLASGTYYLRAYTQYANNFVEDESFSTTITILNPLKPGNETNIEEDYDIQLLPEGGQLVENVLSVVGFKIVDANGKGVYISEAEVKDDQGESIALFKSNISGIGKFTITPAKGKTYKAFITINGEIKEVPFPAIQKRGIVMNASKHITKDLLLVNLKTNTDTYKNIQNAKYHLVIHQNKNAKALPASFVDDALQTDFIIPFADLYPGTNIITLFDDNAKPIAERLFFNHLVIPQIQTSVHNTQVVNDSIRISLKNTLNTAGIRSNMSISVLPEETVSNTNPENIVANLLLKPYIKGQIENPSQYFTKIDRRSLYHLDLLLLTQGWSKYDWNAIFNHQEVKTFFDREVGISMFINLNNTKIGPETSLSVTSMENGIFESYELKEKKTLELKNFALLDSSKVQFSLLRKGKASKAAVSVRFEPSQTGTSPNFKPLDLSNKKTVVSNSKTDPKLISFIANREELEEVIIKTVKNKKDDINDIRGLTLGANGRVIDEETSKQFRDITDLIRTFGFQIGRDQNARITIKKSNRGQDSFVLGTVTDPIIFFNGSQLQSQNLDILDGLRTSDVSRIYYKERENSYGRAGNAGVIYIYSKKNLGTAPDVAFNEYQVPFGFSSEKQFYTPKYMSYTNDIFQKYGTIGWNPNVNTDAQGNASFDILNTGAKKVNLFIQGMNGEGALISKTMVLEIK